MINVDYPDLLKNFPEHIDPKRSESASFLIWYLEKYYRLEPQEASDPESSEAKMITEYSNNQNGVRPRDLKSNHQIQIRLQREFADHYSGIFVYEIKRGEIPKFGQAISNEEASLYLMAFDLREPWATHRKYEVFEDKHATLFGRPEVTADRIVLCKVISDEIEARLPALQEQLLAKYILTKYMIMHVLRSFFDTDEFFQEIIHDPASYMRDYPTRKKFGDCIGVFVDEIIVDLNLESQDFGDDFDYRGKLRDADWVKDLTKKLLKDYLKQKGRGKSSTFKQVWDSE